MPRFPENRDSQATRPHSSIARPNFEQPANLWDTVPADTARAQTPLKRYLEYDPFLRYLEENETLYRVLTGDGRVITVPKDRAITAPFPPAEPTPLQPVYRWLGLALLGLPFGGLPTLVFVVVAAMVSQRIQQQSLSRIERRRLTMALICATILWLVALMLSFLFVLHLI
jgi:hypothetical protein